MPPPPRASRSWSSSSVAPPARSRRGRRTPARWAEALNEAPPRPSPSPGRCRSRTARPRVSPSCRKRRARLGRSQQAAPGRRPRTAPAGQPDGQRRQPDRQRSCAGTPARGRFGAGRAGGRGCARTGRSKHFGRQPKSWRRRRAARPFGRSSATPRQQLEAAPRHAAARYAGRKHRTRLGSSRRRPSASGS